MILSIDRGINSTLPLNSKALGILDRLLELSVKSPTAFGLGNMGITGIAFQKVIQIPFSHSTRTRTYSITICSPTPRSICSKKPQYTTSTLQSHKNHATALTTHQINASISGQHFQSTSLWQRCNSHAQSLTQSTIGRHRSPVLSRSTFTPSRTPRLLRHRLRSDVSTLWSHTTAPPPRRFNHRHFVAPF